jgi:hypothetical protein
MPVFRDCVGVPGGVVPTGGHITLLERAWMVLALFVRDPVMSRRS